MIEVKHVAKQFQSAARECMRRCQTRSRAEEVRDTLIAAIKGQFDDLSRKMADRWGTRPRPTAKKAAKKGGNG